MPNQNQPWPIYPHDAEIVADQRAGDDQQRHPEQQIDQEMLPLASWPPAMAGARNSAAPIQESPIQTIGAWIWTSRRKLKGRKSIDRDAVEARPVK